MLGACSQILLHVVLGAKHRRPWITPDIAGRLYPCIVRAQKGVLYDIGGPEYRVRRAIRVRLVPLAPRRFLRPSGADL